MGEAVVVAAPVGCGRRIRKAACAQAKIGVVHAVH
jgi:hypothetical protein